MIQSRRFGGWRHGWWLVLIILLVAAAGGAYLNESQRCRAFNPTGDALYDRYAQAVISRHGWSLFTIQGDDSTNPATLPDELLAAWETDFGDNPHYWQLRYWCAKYRHYDSKDYSPHADDDAVAGIKHLETAWQRGVADSETLLLLYLAAPRVWYRQLLEEHDAFPDDPVGFSGVDREKDIAVSAEFEARTMSLLDEAVTLGPDQCWPYWERGILQLSYGEEAAGLADLRAGNSCSINVIPVCFPASQVISPNPQHPGFGNDVLAGAILDLALGADYLSMNNLARLKTTAKEQSMRMALGGDTELTDVLHHTFCRMAVADRNHGLHQYAMAVFDFILADACLKHCSASLNNEQVDVLSELESGFYYIQRKEELRATCNYLEYPALAQAVEDRRYPAPGLPAVLTHNIQDHRSPGHKPMLNSWAKKTDAYLLKYPWRYYQRLGAFWLEKSGAGLYDSEFETLDEVDYSDLHRPESWGPYPLFLN